jgi:hypothetical protein
MAWVVLIDTISEVIVQSYNPLGYNRSTMRFLYACFEYFKKKRLFSPIVFYQPKNQHIPHSRLNKIHFHVQL